MNRQTSPEDEMNVVHALNQMMSNGQKADGARSVVVNRTHRVVRDQAIALRERKQQSRDLMAPFAIFSVLMLVSCYAIWAIFDAADLSPNGVPDASDQLSILLLWSLPVTAMVLGLVWFKRGRGRSGSNNEVQ